MIYTTSTYTQPTSLSSSISGASAISTVGGNCANKCIKLPVPTAIINEYQTPHTRKESSELSMSGGQCHDLVVACWHWLIQYDYVSRWAYDVYYIYDCRSWIACSTYSTHDHRQRPQCLHHSWYFSDKLIGINQFCRAPLRQSRISRCSRCASAIINIIIVVV